MPRRTARVGGRSGRLRRSRRRPSPAGRATWMPADHSRHRTSIS
jgi:hypothetical protein